MLRNETIYRVHVETVKIRKKTRIILAYCNETK